MSRERTFRFNHLSDDCRSDWPRLLRLLARPEEEAHDKRGCDAACPEEAEARLPDGRRMVALKDPFGEVRRELRYVGYPSLKCCL